MGEPSFYWSDSTPRVSDLLRAREASNLAARNTFSLQRCSRRSCEPSRCAGATFRVATGLSKSGACKPVKRKTRTSPYSLVCIKLHTLTLQGAWSASHTELKLVGRLRGREGLRLRSR